MVIIIYSRARYIKTALETKEILRRQRSDVLLLLFGQLIYFIPGRNHLTGKYIFLLKEKQNDGKNFPRTP